MVLGNLFGSSPKTLQYTNWKKTVLSRAVVEDTFNPSTWEAEACQVDCWGQPGLKSELQDSPGYTEKPCLNKKKKKNIVLNDDLE